VAGGVVQAGGSAGRRGRRRARRARPIAEINVTPFVDVMLVLLIIFMVAAPLLTAGVPVALPRTAATALPQEAEPPLTVTLTADGLVLVQDVETAEGALIPQLRSAAAGRADPRVYLRADGALPYERVAQVMGALNAGGFTDIGLVTETGGPAFGGE
jgi:biopolymer transport protein TolR